MSIDEPVLTAEPTLEPDPQVQPKAQPIGPAFEYADLPKVTFPEPPPSKRALDIVLGTTLLIMLLPVLLLIGLVVATTSDGPIFFSQRRVGRSGKAFKMWKFRSMYADAEERLERDPKLRRLYESNDFKLPEGTDPRITGVGRFLRKTSLDELPQLFNVVSGNMSLVGPRPVQFREVARYGSRVAMYTAVRPGMTGLWQVSGRSTIGFPERADLDEEYVRSMSVATDLKLLVRTIPAVLGGGGAH